IPSKYLIIITMEFRILNKLLEYLQEDIPFEDLSTNLVPEGLRAKASIEARENFKVFGVKYAEMLMRYFELNINPLKRDGDWVKKGDILIKVEGNARKILMLERTVLNLISRLSGITTQTAYFVIKAKNLRKDIIVACTRKTTPGLRYFEKMAVKAGGGDTHRFSLSDSIMIKDNHLKALGGVENALKIAKELSSFAHKIEVEVENLDDAVKAAELGADIVMLDNMPPEEIKKVVEIFKERGYYGKVLLEASGGITFENLEEYVRTGVNVISSGALTYGAKWVDVALELEV
ncbi:MAG: carboxylating nicotinate-nucleotide diphosphorylase, partial [candidate division WOR-3 bacterium]